MDEQCKRRRRIVMRWAAAGGALLGLLCQFLPVDYQDACRAVVQAASMTCGG